jgi:hypothetical protein
MEGWTTTLVRCDHWEQEVRTAPGFGDGVATCLLSMATTEGCDCAMPKLRELLGDEADATVEYFREMKRKRLYAGPGGRITATPPG